MILYFGRYQGQEIKDCPISYIEWLAEFNKQDVSVECWQVPQSIEQEACNILYKLNYASNRLKGMHALRVDYVIEVHNELGRSIEAYDNKSFHRLECALIYVKVAFGYPDSENTRIMIWEIAPSGHKKVVWHFSGWRYLSENFFKLEQGKYPGDSESAFDIAMEQVCEIEESEREAK